VRYTQYFNITPAVCSPPTVCLAGTCIYFEYTATGIKFLGYGHRVTVTILASDVLPTRLGAYSDTSGEFAIDFNPPTVGAVISRNFALTDTFIEFELQPSTGVNFNIRVDYDLAPGETAANDFCAYGTRLKASVQSAEVITEALIATALLAAPEFEWVTIAIGALFGLTWVPGNVCAGPPPPIPRFDASDFIIGTDIPLPQTFTKLWTLWEALNWSRVCECIPATGINPPAKPFPPPVYGLPPDTVAAPPVPIVCDETDLCASLNTIMRQLAALQATATSTQFVAQLIQRQAVPFAYVPGVVHPALVGGGEFSVLDLIGLSVTFAVIPPGKESGSTDPITYHQLGKVSLGTAAGWRRSWQPTHSPYLILPIAAAFTRVGYSFADGVVATITELLREP